MTTNTKESGLEELIVNSLVHDNGYEQGRIRLYQRQKKEMEIANLK